MPGCRWNRRFLLGQLKMATRTSLIRRDLYAPALVQARFPQLLRHSAERRGKQAWTRASVFFFAVDFRSFVYEYEFMFMLLNKHFLAYGVVGWIVATAALRGGGQHVLGWSEWKAILALYLVSFILMSALARRLLLALRINQEQVLGAVVSLLLPTLLLDPFSSAFFSAVFPNMAPEAAGAFGGWMLISCAGALVGGMTYRTKPTT